MNVTCMLRWCAVALATAVVNTNAVAGKPLKKVWRHKLAVSYYIFIARAFLGKL
jgi:hypothetical protein